MTRILVAYYSSYGHVRALAQAEAEGAQSVPGTIVDLRRIPETVPGPSARRPATLLTKPRWSAPATSPTTMASSLEPRHALA